MLTCQLLLHSPHTTEKHLSRDSASKVSAIFAKEWAALLATLETKHTYINKIKRLTNQEYQKQ